MVKKRYYASTHPSLVEMKQKKVKREHKEGRWKEKIRGNAGNL